MFKDEKVFIQIESDIDAVVAQSSHLGKKLWKSLLEAHPADIAQLISKLDEDKQESLFKKLPKTLSVDVFIDLPVTLQVDLIDKLDVDQATLILKNIHTDQLADLFDELSDEDLKKYLSLLQRKQRHQIISLLNLDPDAAGRWMNSDILSLQKDLTVKKCIGLLQRLSPKKELLRTIYVTNKEHKLIGYINLEDLVLNRPDTSLADFLQENELVVNVQEDQETVAEQMDHYGLMSAPVVDDKNHFLGVITADDIFEVIKEESSEDVYKMSAVPPIEHSYFESPVLKLVWQRATWLISLLLLQSISGFIMAGYKDILSNNTVLALFITMLIGTGGNAGNQSSALVIRGLATGEISREKGLKVLLREFGVAILMAIILVVVAFGRVFYFHPSFLIASTISLALFIIVITSILLGTFLPLLLERLRIDPAHSAVPFLATLMDIIGILIYFFVASRILG